MPKKLQFFIDALRVITNCNFKGCTLKPPKSKLDSLQLGVVWKYPKNKNARQDFQINLGV